MGKTGGGVGTNQYAVRGVGQVGTHSAAVLNGLAADTIEDNWEDDPRPATSAAPITGLDQYARNAPIREATQALARECADRSTPPERFTEIARELERSGARRPALALAANPSVPPSMLADLATSWNLAELRCAAVKNPSCPREVVADRAVNDRSEKVRKAASKRL